MSELLRSVRAIAFDKDGTLFGFQATWGGWAADLVAALAEGDPDLADDLAARIDLDRAGRVFRPESPAIAGTEAEIVALLAPALPHWSVRDLITYLAESSARIDPSEVVPLAPFLRRLKAGGLGLGVVTNDSEASARAQLATVQSAHLFDVIYGYDSGHGAKPEPGPCLAFAAQMGLEPRSVAMVGDSRHDLLAGRAAGMVTVAVLTGVATEPDLADLADLVLPDIGALTSLVLPG